MHDQSRDPLFALLEVDDAMGKEKSVATATRRPDTGGLKRCSLGCSSDDRAMFVAFKFLPHHRSVGRRTVASETPHLSLGLAGGGQMVLIRLVRNHITVPVCEANIVLRVFHRHMSSPEIAVHDYRCCVFPSAYSVSDDLQSDVWGERLRVVVLLPSRCHIDTRPWARRALDREGPWSRLWDSWVANCRQLTGLEVPPLPREAQQVSVAILRVSTVSRVG